jgi:hypothetical protein
MKFDEKFLTETRETEEIMKAELASVGCTT